MNIKRKLPVNITFTDEEGDRVKTDYEILKKHGITHKAIYLKGMELLLELLPKGEQ